MKKKQIIILAIMVLFVANLLFLVYIFKDPEDSYKIDEINEERILEIARNSTSIRLGDISFDEIGDIKNWEINFLDDNWHINATLNYDFGCCSGCSPGNACASVCSSCGVKTLEVNFIISSDGKVIKENFEEIVCRENEGGWWRSREMNGGNCLVVEGEYKCPNYGELDCSPNILPEMMYYCVEPYHQWIKDNCDILFDYGELPEEEPEEDEVVELLSVEIINPSDNAKISNSSVKIEAITNRNTTCEYSVEFTHPNLGESLLEGQMSVTGEKTHSHNIDLEFGGYYTLTISCGDETDSVEFDAKVPYEFEKLSGTDTHHRFVGDYIGSSTLRDTDLKSSLRDQSFYNGEDILVWAVQSVKLYNKKIENSTSGGDLASEEVLIELNGENYPADPYIYEYQIIFSKSLNMSTMHNSRDYIEILGEFYKVQEGSNNSRFVLRKDGSDEDIVFEHNEPIMLNGEIVDDSSIVDLGDVDSDKVVTKIIIKTGLRESDKDYIGVGEHYDHWLFRNLRLSFESYNGDVGAETRLGSINWN